MLKTEAVTRMRRELYEEMTDAAQHSMLANHAAKNVKAQDTAFKARLAATRLQTAAERYNTFVALQGEVKLTRQQLILMCAVAVVQAVTLLGIAVMQ